MFPEYGYRNFMYCLSFHYYILGSTVEPRVNTTDYRRAARDSGTSDSDVDSTGISDTSDSGNEAR